MRSARVWVLLVAAVVVAVAVLAATSPAPQRPLDPTSTAQDGSRALVHVLTRFGVRVERSADADIALAGSSSVVVTDPDAFSAAQLRGFAARAGRVLLVAPGVRSLRALGLAAEPDSQRVPSSSPGCSDPGAQAAGTLDLPADAVGYDGLATSCYGGLAGIAAGRVAVLGSSRLVQNGALAGAGVAALDVNLVTANRALRQVVWLTPGANAGGSGPASIWDLFPGAVYRAFAWALLLGVLVVLWRARRLGGVTREPLPVVVHATEVVEGHGRLYERVAARDHAAGALREATLVRLRRRLSLAPYAGPAEVAARIGTPAAGVLTAPPPHDDAGLVRLAQQLDRLEEDVHRG